MWGHILNKMNWKWLDSICGVDAYKGQKTEEQLSPKRLDYCLGPQPSLGEEWVDWMVSYHVTDAHSEVLTMAHLFNLGTEKETKENTVTITVKILVCFRLVPSVLPLSYIMSLSHFSGNNLVVFPPKRNPCHLEGKKMKKERMCSLRIFIFLQIMLLFLFPSLRFFLCSFKIHTVIYLLFCIFLYISWRVWPAEDGKHIYLSNDTSKCNI